MTDSVKLKLTSCEQCPNMKSERHYTADSWENVQEWKCTGGVPAADGGGQHIAYQEWNDPTPIIPSWCPLRDNPTKILTPQEIEFKEMIPRVTYVLDMHDNVLTPKEIGILTEYLTFISNKSSGIVKAIEEEAKAIVKYLHRV